MDWTAPVTLPATASAGLSDTELVARILAGQCELFEIVMRRHNQQLYRAARAILRDEAEVEDVLQQAYLNVFAHLEQFEARSQLSTWLTRIVINEACARRRRSQRNAPSTPAAGSLVPSSTLDGVPSGLPSPEHQAYAGELPRVLEEAVDALPEPYRVVFMLRDVEGMSTSETGTVLELGVEAVKTRLHRARAMLRRVVAARVGAAAPGTFQFQVPRCDRVVHGVLRQLAGLPLPAPPRAV
jgi:RNA polymerase sigma-70 factor (ECF subfamily)